MDSKQHKEGTFLQILHLTETQYNKVLADRMAVSLRLYFSSYRVTKMQNGVLRKTQ